MIEFWRWNALNIYRLKDTAPPKILGAAAEHSGWPHGASRQAQHKKLVSGLHFVNETAKDPRHGQTVFSLFNDECRKIDFAASGIA